GHVLRGMLERWPVLFRDEWAASVAKYGGAFAERYGLYDGAQQAKGTRSSYGGLWGNFEQLAWPVGMAKARVLCGEKAAMAFCKEGNHTTVRDYRAAAGGNCSFRIVSWLSDEFDLMVTFPFADLRGKTVVRKRNDDASIVVPVSFDERPDTLLLRQVANGDVVTIGEVPAEASVLACSVSVPRAVGPRQVEGFHAVDFSRNANHELPEVWDDNASFAGLPKGERSIFRVPFWFNLRGPITARDAHVPVDVKATHLFCLVTGLKAGSRLTVRFANGSSEAPVGKAVPVVSGWPQCFDWHADLVALDTGGREILSVWPQGCDLLAVTTTMKATKELTPVFAAVETRRKLLVAQQASLEELKRLAQPMSAFSGHLAILPVPPPSTASSSSFVKMLRQARAIDYFRILSPEEMVSSTVLDPAQYFLAVDVGGENYYQNVNGKEDGDRAIQGYLRGGGTLLVLSPGPFPFYYNEKGTPVVSAPKFGLPIAGSGLENRQDKLEGVKVSGWEKPPVGAKLTFEVNTTPKILPDLPAKFPFPTEGDPRWRPIVNVVSEQDVYTPLLTLKDGKGQSYGDGGAIIEFKSGDLKGGRVVYVWGPLLSNEKYGSAILRGLLNHVLKTTFPPPARALVARTSEKVTVDGDLSDDAWKQARELSFSRFLTGTGKPSQATRAKMLYDEENLYVAFDCEDSSPQPKYAEHDANLWEGDVVEVYVDPSGSGRHYKEIEVNPANVVVDLDIAEVKNDAPQDVPNYKKWNCAGMQTAAKLTEGKGWTAELAIPLRSLSDVAPKMGDSWRVQLYRIDRPKTVPEGEFVSWSSTRSFHVPDRFGYITFGGDPNGDDFSSYPNGSKAAPNWTVASGKWEVRDGVYLGSDCPGDGWRSVGALWGDDNLCDFTASLRFRILDFGMDWRDGPWIGLRQDTQGNGYILCFNSWNVTLHKQSGSATTNDDHPLAMAKWIRDGEWHAARIAAKGNHFAVYLDDKLLMEATDDEALGAPAVPCGRLTLAARRWSQSEKPSRVAFDDLTVTRK
ncbi:MAG: hypothetical protein HY318_04005, partial [Armatimonadetes bacterium]|nr:hypothetical protein [Armatimonadota bacterium]